MRGTRSFRGTQRIDNENKNPIDALVDCRIIEANDAIAGASQKICPFLVVLDLFSRGMCGAVKLNDKLAIAAQKISEVGADRCLPDKF